MNRDSELIVSQADMPEWDYGMASQLQVAGLLSKSTPHRPDIYLDVSRLLSAGRRRTPSGIERVELAYVKRLAETGQTSFVAAFLWKLHCLPSSFASSYLEALEAGWWSSGRTGQVRTLWKMSVLYGFMLAASARALVAGQVGPAAQHSIYMNLSHENLVSPAPIAEFKLRMRAKMFCLVHDLIPITHPEYARPGQAAAHRRRMDTVAALADAVVVNSAATSAGFLRYTKDRPKVPPVHVVHLGVASQVSPTRQAASPELPTNPYFLIVATIEPRKNHLLLLNLWRSLAAAGISPPCLIIAGRLGWENEMVLDMLERCEAIAGIVEHRRDLSDAALDPLLRGARALLLPSFAEGFGLPVAEALAAGTPVICSDLPALREIGGDVPEYIDPMDGPAWRKAILDYAEPSSVRRDAQCARLRSWSAPSWDRHFEQIAVILEELADGPG